MCNMHLDANDWGWNKKKLKQANAYSLKTLQMTWLGDQVTIWGEDAHHRLGLWALHQHHRHPQPTPWWHRCPDWPCPGNCIFCVEDYKRKHIQQCYLLCLQLPTHTHTHTKRKERNQLQPQTEMPFRDCLLSLPPCCSLSLLAATRLSVVSGWLDLDILEFENHLLLFRPPFMSPTSTAWSSLAWSSCSWWNPPWILSM